jgi:hypothetical protein
MYSVRAPVRSPLTVTGDRPATMMAGTRPRAALWMLEPRFCVPTSTCTSTICGRRLRIAWPCAALSAVISCGHTMMRGMRAPPSASMAAKASMKAGWSLPRLVKMHSTPSRAAS